jgi:hypothetical protein
MTTITLNTVRVYTNEDVYHYTVDNRPLQDLIANDNILLSAIQANIALIARNQNQLVTVPTTSASYTAPAGNNVTLFFNQALTLSITITAEALPIQGDILRIVRSSLATGAFNVTFNSKNLSAASESITWQFDGTNWQEVSYGTLI